MQISKAFAKSGKKIIKAIKKLSPQARLAKKMELERQSSQRVSTRKNEKISMSWWSLEIPKSAYKSQETLADTFYTEEFECRCCCCQFADEENLRNENLENEMLRC